MPDLMTCPDSAKLSQLLRGDASAEEIDSFAKHLETCSSCAQRVEQTECFAPIIKVIRQGPDEVPLAVGDRVEGIMVKIDDLISSRFKTLVGKGMAGDSPDGTASIGTTTSDGSRFRIVRPHAEGGLGKVYVAIDEELHREVALKEIKDSHADDLNSRSRFLLEAEITGGLEHPGIVPVYSLGQYADGRPFYAMRFICGDSLKDAIERFHSRPSSGVSGAGSEGERTLAMRQLLGRFIDVCQAIQYAHDRGILHRDLKPSNIMLGKYGETLVVDWGLAKIVGRSGNQETLASAAGETTLRPHSGSGVPTTIAGSTIGTPAFMSPEQAAGRLDLMGPPSDVYSLGATLYCVLTGCAPFEEMEVAEILRRVQIGDFPRPRQKNANVPEPLEAICLKAMAREPRDRYNAPREIADDIEHWLADEPVGAYRDPWSVRAGRWARKHKPLVSGVAAALLVALIGLSAGTFWYQEEKNREALRRAEAGVAVRHALDQAEAAVEELHEILKKPGGVFELLNRPENWHDRIKLAEATLDHARALAKAETDLDPKLGAAADSLQAALRQDEDDRRLAVRLEKIRLDRAAVVEGAFDYPGAAREYPQAFAEAGLAMPEGETEALASRIRSSRIKEQLVAALDDWAYVAVKAGKEELAERILATGRRAAPDPAWGDRLRHLKLWRDPNVLAKLIKDARPSGLAPQMLQLVGALLGEDSLFRESWLRDAQAQYPADFWLNLQLGDAVRKNNPLEAVGFERVAIATRPDSSAACSVAYSNLGDSLREQKKLLEAMAAHHKAIELDPTNASAYNSLGFALYDQKKLGEAIAAFHKAIDLYPKFAIAYSNLGNTLRVQKKLPEAVTALQKAIELDPKNGNAYYNVGLALYYQKKLPEAIAAFHKAIDLYPKFAKAHGALGLTLFERGAFDEASLATRKALDLLPEGRPLRAVVLSQLKQCQQMLALEKRLSLVLDGKEAAAAGELLKMAVMCQEYKRRYPTAVRLYQDAFKADASLTDDWTKQHRYNAACAAALAAAGNGEEAAKLPAEEKARLRQTAREWLQAELDLVRKKLKAGQPLMVIQAEQRLGHWQSDPDLAGVRDTKKLDGLPESERTTWQAVWTDVAGLLKEARKRYTESRREGALTDKEKSQVHPWKMVAGRTYVIDLESDAFDAFLRLEDPAGKLLAENDDISPDNQNSRLVFTPKADGSYRIVATSFQQVGTGPYTLRIREFDR
jgi:serine/threonine protein kinase/tetratricopeptide (TPR) repeat protein